MKYLFILITWLGATGPFTQDIPIRDLDACKQMQANIEKAWADSPKEFGYVIVCRKNPFYGKK